MRHRRGRFQDAVHLASGPPSTCRTANDTPARQGSAAALGGAVSPSLGRAADATPASQGRAAAQSKSSRRAGNQPKSGAAAAAEKGKRTNSCESYCISYGVKPVYYLDRPGVVFGTTCRFGVAFSHEVAQEPYPTSALSAGACLVRGGSSSAPGGVHRCVFC
jgi:hypothetical protein